MVPKQIRLIKYFFFLVFLLGVIAPFGYAQITSNDPNFTVDTLYTGVSMTAIAFDPDGRLYVCEKQGRVLLFTPNDDGSYSELMVLLDIESLISHTADNGLMGIAISPDFEVNRSLYLSYTTPFPSDRMIEILKVVLTETLDDVESQEVIIGDIPNNVRSHNALDMHFSPMDDSLFISLGDDGRQGEQHVQNLDRYNGKFLRVDEIGHGWPTNPFYDENNPDSVSSRIFAYGFRNPFRFTIHPMTGELLVSENGRASTNGDRVVQIKPESNGGWPGEEEDGDFYDPPEENEIQLLFRSNSAITGIEIANAGPFSTITGNDPSHTYGPDKLYLANWVRGNIKVWGLEPDTNRPEFSEATPVIFDPNEDPGNQNIFIDGITRGTHLTFGPDGTLYVTTSDFYSLALNRLHRVRLRHSVTLTLNVQLIDGRNLAGNPFLEATELRLYESDGTTPLIFEGGVGPEENAIAIEGGSINTVIQLDNVGSAIVVSAGEPSGDGVHPAKQGFLLFGEDTLTKELSFHLSDTVISGRITDTRNRPASVDLGIAHNDQTNYLAVPGGRDFLPPIPNTGRPHRIVSDALGYYNFSIPTGNEGTFHIDLVTDTHPEAYTSALFSSELTLGSQVVENVRLNLQLEGCDDLSDEEEIPMVDYATQIQPIWDANCTGCHAGETPNGGLNLEAMRSYAALVNQPSREVPGVLVQPSDLSLSYLFEKINCNTLQAGTRMPLGTPLPVSGQALIRDWINQGAQASPDPSLIAHWTLDEGSGTTVTTPNGSHTGQFIGNPDWVEGRFGQALSFNSGDGVEVPHNDELDIGDGSFSYGAWVRASGGSSILSKFPTEQNGLGYYVKFQPSGGKVIAWTGNGGNRVTVVSGEEYKDDLWYFVMVVLERSDNEEMTMYIYDETGLLQEEITQDIGVFSGVSIAANTDLLIGSGPNGSLEGEIDEVYLYSRTLSRSEIETLLVEGQPLSQNQPPMVQLNAESTNLIWPDDTTVSLTGIVSDDGMPDPPGALTLSWSQIEPDGEPVNPPTVTFNPDNTENTTVTFTEIGTYTLRLTVDDTDLTTSSDIIVTVRPEGSPFFLREGDVTSATRPLLNGGSSPAYNFSAEDKFTIDENQIGVDLDIGEREQFSFGAWFSISPGARGDYLLAKYHNLTDTGYRLGLQNGVGGKLSAVLGAEGIKYALVTEEEYKTGEWYFAMAVLNRSDDGDNTNDTLKLYVYDSQGILQEPREGETLERDMSSLVGITLETVESESLFIGGNSANFGFDGNLDEIRLYDRILTQEEIQGIVLQDINPEE